MLPSQYSKMSRARRAKFRLKKLVPYGTWRTARSLMTDADSTLRMLKQRPKSRIGHALETIGVYQCHATDLLPLNDWRVLQEFVASLAETNDTDNYEIASVDQLKLDPMVQQLCRHDGILPAMCDYFGHMPLIQSISVWHGNPSTKRALGLPNFHIDRGAIKNVHINILDMDESSGAVEIVPREFSLPFRRRTNAWGGEYFADTEVDALCPTAKRMRGTGRAGTFTFYDPCHVLHRGGRDQTGERLILFISFAPRSKFLAETVLLDPLSLATVRKKLP